MKINLKLYNPVIKQNNVNKNNNKANFSGYFGYDPYEDDEFVSSRTRIHGEDYDYEVDIYGRKTGDYWDEGIFISRFGHGSEDDDD